MDAGFQAGSICPTQAHKAVVFQDQLWVVVGRKGNGIRVRYGTQAMVSVGLKYEGIKTHQMVAIYLLMAIYSK